MDDGHRRGSDGKTQRQKRAECTDPGPCGFVAGMLSASPFLFGILSESEKHEIVRFNLSRRRWNSGWRRCELAQLGFVDRRLLCWRGNQHPLPALGAVDFAPSPLIENFENFLARGAGKANHGKYPPLDDTPMSQSVLGQLMWVITRGRYFGKHRRANARQTREAKAPLTRLSRPGKSH